MPLSSLPHALFYSPCTSPSRWSSPLSAFASSLLQADITPVKTTTTTTTINYNFKNGKKSLEYFQQRHHGGRRVTRESVSKIWSCCSRVGCVEYNFKLFSKTENLASTEGQGTKAHRHHHRAQNSTDNQQHSTARHDRPQEGKASTNSTAKQQQNTTAQHHETAQHHRTRHREAGHHSKPHQPQGIRPRGQRGTPTPKHTASRRPRAAGPSTAPQNTK